MRKLALTVTVGAALISAGAVAVAQEARHPAVAARTSIMQLYQNSLMTLGAMAKGDVDYDAEAASKAAGNLGLLVQLDQSTMWPQGTDTGSIENTRALPALWESFPDVMQKAQALSEAVATMQEAAGTDLASLQAAMGGIGGACSECHKSYRAPRN